MKKALIGDIGRYSTHDGPGIRTTVFFKGCPLNCPWCHNPELISFQPEILFYAERCIFCWECIDACPKNAVGREISGRIDRSKCNGCGKCAEACPSCALKLVGKPYDQNELIEMLLRDRRYYEASGGGVTLSGGEPTAQINFLLPLLEELKNLNIQTAIETCGFFKWSKQINEAFAQLNLIFYDLKIADNEEHRKLLGVSDQRIKTNLKKLIQMRREDVVVRIPIIPGFTATEANLGALADLMKKINVKRCELLPYNPLGALKAERMGLAVNSALPETSMTLSNSHGWESFFHGIELVRF